MEKALVFDMDGTIADLYGVKNWLEDLRAENPRPYEEAEPIYDMQALNTIVSVFRKLGWKIIITTWLSKNSSKEYDRLVREAKLAWLDKYDFEYDEIHLVKYGTTKANCTRGLGGFQVLVDDNEKVREGWTLGSTINANENIIEQLIELLIEYTDKN
jgi:phosphoglycolate phosphatase-like HAD superfamily hydrolase